MNPALLAALKRFAKGLIAAGIAGASGAVLLALQNPNATASFIAASAASGFAAAVLLAAEKYLTYAPTPPAE